MKVKVEDGYQVKHDGKMYTGGDTFDMPKGQAQRLINSGWVKAVSGSKNKAVQSSANKSLENLTVAELRQKASDADIEGRSSMDKDELIEALKGES